MGAEGRIGIRRATLADLGEVRRIWLENELAEQSEPPPYHPSPAIFRHELEHGELWVAECGGRMAGFTATLARGGIVYLAELFVSPDNQSRGVGKRLLGRVTPKDGREFWTVASADPRAQSLYIQAGMRPKWPRYDLRGRADTLRLAPEPGIEIVEAGADDAEFQRWHGEIGGFFDGADHAHFLDQRAARPLWFARGGERIGFACAQMRDDESLWHPDALTIGPLGTRRNEDAAACVVAAVAWACARAEIVQINLVGPHPGLAPLLRAGFEIIYVETLLSTAEPPFNSFERYLF